jgi:hypothetical protein
MERKNATYERRGICSVFSSQSIETEAFSSKEYQFLEENEEFSFEMYENSKENAQENAVDYSEIL